MNYIITESQIERLKLKVTVIKEDNSDDEFMRQIGFGGEHKIYNIDADWVLKMPHKNWMRLPARTIAEKFDKHIKFMQQYPDIFVKAKKLSKFRAAVEKSDINNAEKEIGYLYNLMMTNKDLYDEMLERHKPYRFIDDLYNSGRPEIIQIFKTLVKYGKKHNDEVVNKWCKFIFKLKKTFGDKELDIHSGNIGLDKQGNIKLIDF